LSTEEREIAGDDKNGTCMSALSKEATTFGNGDEWPFT
jgi:hypothetical protein